jgi:hypothetical protein
MEAEAVGEVGYIVKGFPRLSETFIANEIHLLESLGLTLRLYSIVRGDEGRAHGVIARIRAPVTYLPPVTSLSGTSFPLWLSRNLPLFVVGHVRLVRPTARTLQGSAQITRRCTSFTTASTPTSSRRCRRRRRARCRSSSP